VKSKVNRSSLSEQAVGLLRERIYNHALLPGQRLDEALLAEQMGISRTPLREALKVLCAEGLVDLQPHKGCFVAELSLRDLEEIFPIMATLEGRVAHEVAQKRTPATAQGARRAARKIGEARRGRRRGSLLRDQLCFP
jgi:DNA-binding GntR family transcriptional regulator